MTEVELSVSEFVAVFNQTLTSAYPSVVVVGELANFRVSKNRWLYFDLKDDAATVRFFGTVYNLPGPLEDGMLLKVRARPSLHPQYGFSLNVLQITPSGEGSIKRAALLLQQKLTAEGLFDPARKRTLPYPPQKIGLITSIESAAYSDFVKVLAERWGGVEIQLIDVQVQGELAPDQIVRAVNTFNQAAKPVEVIVLIRGGGSAEDLQAFSAESVTRAVASSRIPTLVAIGHERDVCLAELAADTRASTPSNAAELLVPERTHRLALLKNIDKQLADAVVYIFNTNRDEISRQRLLLSDLIERHRLAAKDKYSRQAELLRLLNPMLPLNRGYAVVRSQRGEIIRSIKRVKTDDLVNVSLADGNFDTIVKQLNLGGALDG